MSLDALTQAALLGTGRQAAPAVELPLTRPDAKGPEQQLLRDAAVLRVYRDAGAKPETVTSLPTPAPEETKPVCPQLAAAHLATILGTYPDLLEGWLKALAASGRVIGPWHVRGLLDHASDNVEIALALEPVLSERARWLAAQHEPWAWAAGTGDPGERWQTGTRAERLHVFAVLRARDPNAARALVESTFAEDNARDRAAFVAALGPALPEDEPFLETALQDRSEPVRIQAAMLLSGIRGGAFSERMRARAAELVNVGRRTISVHFPRELTPELVRDGLGDAPSHDYGRRAWLASQIIGFAPLDMWDSPDILKRRVADGNGKLLREALLVAAGRQRDPAWAIALIEHRLNVHVVFELLAAVPREQAERHLLQGLKDRDGHWLAAAVPGPWSAELTRKAAERVAMDEHPERWADFLALRGDPALADHLPQPDPASNAGLQLRAVAAKLALRRAMLDALKETV